jgi:hypothetical protein
VLLSSDPEKAGSSRFLAQGLNQGQEVMSICLLLVTVYTETGSRDLYKPRAALEEASLCGQ